MLVNFDRARGHGAGCKLIAPKAASRAAEADSHGWLADHVSQRVPQSLDIPVLCQQAGLIVAHCLMNAAHIGSHDGSARTHSFEDADGQSFEVG